MPSVPYVLDELDAAQVQVFGGVGRQQVGRVDAHGLDGGVAGQLGAAPQEGQELVVVQAPHPVRARRLQPAQSRKLVILTIHISPNAFRFRFQSNIQLGHASTCLHATLQCLSSARTPLNGACAASRLLLMGSSAHGPSAHDSSQLLTSTPSGPCA